MHPAYVDNLANDNYSVNHLPVRQDLFERTVDAKGMKTKKSKETLPAFLTIIKQKETTRRSLGRQGNKIFWTALKNLCKAAVMQVYSTMIQTTAAFAEPKKRSLKIIL